MPRYLTIQINERLQPVHRGAYEDPLDEALGAAGLGSITGGGTKLGRNKEIEFCDIEIEAADGADLKQIAQVAKNTLESLGLAKGSHVLAEDLDEKVPVGVNEGLALYLNGTELPAEVYKASDVNDLIEQCERLLGEKGRMHSYWEGPAETALYFYGPSFVAMKSSMAGLLATYPLCQKARVVQIA